LTAAAPLVASGLKSRLHDDAVQPPYERRCFYREVTRQARERSPGICALQRYTTSILIDLPNSLWSMTSDEVLARSAE
jgi:hypothetical protein